MTSSTVEDRKKMTPPSSPISIHIETLSTGIPIARNVSSSTKPQHIENKSPHDGNTISENHVNSTLDLPPQYFDDNESNIEDDEDEKLLSELCPSTKTHQNILNRDEDLDRLLNINPFNNCTTIHSDSTLNDDDTTIPTSNRQKQLSKRLYCGYFSMIGNIIILNITYYAKYQLCVLGPHWYGCIVTLTLLNSASYHFITKAYQDVGWRSSCICVIFNIITHIFMFFVSCVDPGIVRKDDADDHHLKKSTIPKTGDHRYQLHQSKKRYCRFCRNYQPPNAMHCKDCNLCIEGYDHHCPWLGICIGKRNMKAFVRFNLCWLSYLLYCIVWVTWIGPSNYESSSNDTTYLTMKNSTNLNTTLLI